MSVGRQLCGALVRSARVSGARVQVVGTRCVPWASGLFEGERHDLEARATASSSLDRWIAALPELDLPIGGHVVLEMLVVERQGRRTNVRLRIEVLTIARD